MQLKAMQNCVTTWVFENTTRSYENPFEQVRLSAKVTDPNGSIRHVPGFWAGDRRWCIRYASDVIGEHTYETVCSDETNSSLHAQQGSVVVIPYRGENELYRHGALKANKEKMHLQHQDGKPFFWLADTWWMGFCERLSWPEGFLKLTEDRVRKGFTVIQIVAGLYPDMEPFDERGKNEAGFAWDRAFTSINPAYFEAVDRRMAWLVDQGLVPCLVGCWGFYIDFVGKDVIKRHWDYLSARYGAYPVVYCMAGEALMPFYNNKQAKSGHKQSKAYADRVRSDWTEVTRHVRDCDPYQRVVTVHPTDYGHKMLDDDELIDLNMLQTGHGSYMSLANTVTMVKTAVDRKPAIPVINSEACYEGICGTCYEDVQRFLFWSCMLSGACGHTYGANGIWQVNSKQKPYGASPHGATWGNTPWEEALQRPGSTQVGIGKKVLSGYRWWQFRAYPSWVENHASRQNDYMGPFAAGIPRSVRVFFIPVFGGFGWGQIRIRQIEPDVTYHAVHYDPVTGDATDAGEVIPDANGEWVAPKVKIFQDWVLVLEAV